MARPCYSQPTPSPSPSTAGIYFQTAGSAQLTSGPTIAVQAPLTSQGVAAGNYRVDATVVVSDPTDGNASTVTCYLQMGGVNSPISQQSIPDGITASGSLATIPLLYVYSGVPTGAHVSVTCSSTGQGSAATVLSATLIAEPVGSIG